MTSWYLSFLVEEIGRSFRDDTLSYRHCRYLIAAGSDEEAYEKSLQLGQLKAGTGEKTYGQNPSSRFRGVSDLLLLDEKPQDGSELMWIRLELDPSEIERQVASREKLSAFQSSSESHANWFVAHTVLQEVHDEGSHGDKVLVWINSYLLSGSSPELVYAKAIQKGREQEGGEKPSHYCDGEGAHWEFKGLQDFIRIHEPPEDGALLWCNTLNLSSEQLQTVVPKKSNLGVFRWRREYKDQHPDAESL